jgi:DNA repair protein RadD
MSPELRDYQLDVIEHCRREVARGRRRILLVAPTGSGKTIMAANIVASAAGNRAVFLAPRRELIVQAVNKLADCGIDAGCILPGYPHRPDQPVQVASVWSLEGRALRSSKIDMPPADVVVVDEAHHARAPTFVRLLQQYPEAVILGLTATPCRGDGRGLGNVFDCIVEAPSVAELTRLGHLVRAVVFAPSTPDLTGVKVRDGDYIEAQLAERVDTPKLIGDTNFAAAASSPNISTGQPRPRSETRSWPGSKAARPRSLQIVRCCPKGGTSRKCPVWSWHGLRNRSGSFVKCPAAFCAPTRANWTR